MIKVIDTKLETNAIHKGLDGRVVKNRCLSSMTQEVLKQCPWKFFSTTATQVMGDPLPESLLPTPLIPDAQ
jgi:hypothetical protein